MSFQRMDLTNKKHQVIALTIQKLVKGIDHVEDLKIDEENHALSYRGRIYNYTFYKVDNRKYCSVLSTSKKNEKVSMSYLRYDTQKYVKNKHIKSKSGSIHMPKQLTMALVGMATASSLLLGLGKVDTLSKRPSEVITINQSPTISSFSSLEITDGPPAEEQPKEIAPGEAVQKSIEYFVDIQTGKRREGAKYFRYEGTTVGRNLLKSRNTMEFMGDEITKWSTYYGLDPKFVMALFTLERPWLPMDNDLVAESYHPTYMGKGIELNVAQITTGSASVYTVPTFINGKFAGMKTYDNGTGQDGDEHFVISEVKTNRSLSIQVGCMILAYNINYYQGDAIYAALAYNTGPNHVNTKISEEEFFRDGNSNSLDDKTYASDIVRYMANQGITNCDFQYIDKNTGEVKVSKYDFDASDRNLHYKEMNLNSSSEIPRLAKETFENYLAKYGKVVEHHQEDISLNTGDEDVFALVEDDYKNLTR